MPSTSKNPGYHRYACRWRSQRFKSLARARASRVTRFRRRSFLHSRRTRSSTKILEGGRTNVPGPRWSLDDQRKSESRHIYSARGCMYATHEIGATMKLQDEATHCTAARHELISLENHKRRSLRLSSRSFDLAFHLPSSGRRDNYGWSWISMWRAEGKEAALLMPYGNQLCSLTASCCCNCWYSGTCFSGGWFGPKRREAVFSSFAPGADSIGALRKGHLRERVEFLMGKEEIEGLRRLWLFSSCYLNRFLCFGYRPQCRLEVFLFLGKLLVLLNFRPHVCFDFK